MPAYMFAQISVTDESVWSQYRAAVTPVVEKFGGKYLMRGATIEVLEGKHDGRRVIFFEFPSMDAIHDFWNSEAYAGLKALRAGAATLDVWAAPGI